MDAARESDPALGKNRTTVQRKSDRELVVTRLFNGPARVVFEAWTRPELLKRWWAPKSSGVRLLSCEADVRVGGTYRFEFGQGDSRNIAFFGKYLEVTPHARLVWTDDESDDSAVTTVTFEDRATRRCWSCTSAIPRRRLSIVRSQGWREGCPNSSRNWTSFSSPWACDSDAAGRIDSTAVRG